MQRVAADQHISDSALQLCRCRNCPTCKDALETEKWFCEGEVSVRIRQEVGCLCGACVKGEGLVKLYFCTAGVSGERRPFG